MRNLTQLATLQLFLDRNGNIGYHVSSITNYGPRPRAAGRFDNMGQETLAQSKGTAYYWSL